MLSMKSSDRKVLYACMMCGVVIDEAGEYHHPKSDIGKYLLRRGVSHAPRSESCFKKWLKDIFDDKRELQEEIKNSIQKGQKEFRNRYGVDENGNPRRPFPNSCVEALEESFYRRNRGLIISVYDALRVLIEDRIRDKKDADLRLNERASLFESDEEARFPTTQDFEERGIPLERLVASARIILRKKSNGQYTNHAEREYTETSAIAEEIVSRAEGWSLGKFRTKYESLGQ